MSVSDLRCLGTYKTDIYHINSTADGEITLLLWCCHTALELLGTDYCMVHFSALTVCVTDKWCLTMVVIIYLWIMLVDILPFFLLFWRLDNYAVSNCKSGFYPWPRLSLTLSKITSSSSDLITILQLCISGFDATVICHVSLGGYLWLGNIWDLCSSYFNSHGPDSQSWAIEVYWF